MSSLYLISINQVLGEASMQALQTLRNDLQQLAIQPERIDTRHTPPHWVSVHLDDEQVKILQGRYQNLIFGADSALSF